MNLTLQLNIVKELNFYNFYLGLIVKALKILIKILLVNEKSV